LRCRLGPEGRNEAQLAVESLRFPLRKIGEGDRDLVAGSGALDTVAKANDDVGTLACDARVLHLLLLQQRADVRRVAVNRLVQRGLRIDLQQEVDAAAQV